MSSSSTAKNPSASTILLSAWELSSVVCSVNVALVLGCDGVVLITGRVVWLVVVSGVDSTKVCSAVGTTIDVSVVDLNGDDSLNCSAVGLADSI